MVDLGTTKIYEPEFGLEGTIPQLVDWANRYTQDYSDEALERISELAREFGLEDKYVEIPILLRNERLKEDDGTLASAYARLQIDHYLGYKISLNMSNYGEAGTELEIWEENEIVIISLNGCDEEGCWTAAGRYSIEEFMNNACNWLDSAIGSILYYSKEYDKEKEA